MNKNNKKGFTLAELLIVVAIIGVLVAISVPIFTTQLEKSREATDMSNVRSAYAEVTADYLTNGGTGASASVTARQQVSGWQNSEFGKLNTRVNGSESEISFEAVVASGTYLVTIDASGSVSVGAGN